MQGLQHKLQDKHNNGSNSFNNLHNAQIKFNGC
jgi:hypothetical protein